MGRGCEKGACEARSRREEKVNAGSSSTTSNAEIDRNPYFYCLQAPSAHLLCSGSLTMAEHRLRRRASHLD